MIRNFCKQRLISNIKQVATKKSNVVRQNHFSSFEYQHYFKSLTTYLGSNLQQRAVYSNYYSAFYHSQTLSDLT